MRDFKLGAPCLLMHLAIIVFAVMLCANQTGEIVPKVWDMFSRRADCLSRPYLSPSSFFLLFFYFIIIYYYYFIIVVEQVTYCKYRLFAAARNGGECSYLRSCSAFFPEGYRLYLNSKSFVKDGIYVEAAYIRLLKTKVENSSAEKECP